MADYRSTLTGTQMDSALLDMAEHNSEAYAVGERNGIAVAPDDVTYHNNARYYAQIASSQIVGDASSAVRWDTDQSEALTDAQKAQARENINAASDSDVVKITSQTLTSAEQAQARANIAAGGSNRNLLDNPWFTVNQRGLTSGTVATGTAEYFVDRWKTAYATYTVNSDKSITTSWNGSGLGAYLIQYFAAESVALLEGKTVTLSVDINGNILTKTFAIPTVAGSGVTYQLGTQVWMKCNNVKNSNRGIEIQIYHTFTNGATIRAVKLELGSVSTLANDASPDYAEELRKCKYYYREWSITSAGGFAIAWPWSNANATIMNIFGIGNEMRTKSPTITWSGSWTVRTQSGANIAITNISKADSPTALGIDITVASGLTNNQPCRVTADSGAKITFSEDL